MRTTESGSIPASTLCGVWSEALSCERHCPVTHYYASPSHGHSHGQKAPRSLILEPTCLDSLQSTSQKKK